MADLVGAKYVRALVVMGLMFALVGCASTIPEPIRDAPENHPRPDEVRSSPDVFKGTKVRWGGTIVSVSNKARMTAVEVVARPLGLSAEPEAGDRSMGRFIARVPGFLDPAVYEAGRRLTVTGSVRGIQERAIGDYPYTFPIVAVDGYYLWPREPDSDTVPGYPYDPYWHDPWYPRSMFYPHCPYGGSPRYCW